jgi:hypothetical protein
MNQSIIFYPARYPKPRAVTIFSTALPGRGIASRPYHRVARSMCGHDDIAFDSLTGSYCLIQRTIEAVLINVSSYRAE